MVVGIKITPGHNAMVVTIKITPKPKKTEHSPKLITYLLNFPLIIFKSIWTCSSNKHHVNVLDM